MSQTPRPGPLYDPNRQAALQAKGRRIGSLFGLAVAAAFALIFWHLEGLWWLSLGLFVGVFVLSAATTWLVTWKPTPTIRCLACGGRGWIDDLFVSAGACPACGAKTFAYYRYRGKHAPLVEDEIAGRDLVERRREVGLPWV